MERFRPSALEVVEIHATVIPIELAFWMRPEHWLMKLLNRIMGILVSRLPGLFAYQYVLVARPVRPTKG